MPIHGEPIWTQMPLEGSYDCAAVPPEIVSVHSAWEGVQIAEEELDAHITGSGFLALGDFLTNRKVPRVVRDRLPLLEGTEGLVWICGHRIDERVRVSSETELVLSARFFRF